MTSRISWRRSIALTLLTLLSSSVSGAAEPMADAPKEPTKESTKVRPPAESPGTLRDILREGTVSGGLRTAFMATGNVGELQDWTSFGVGANLGAQSGRLFHFGAGLRFYSATQVAGNVGALDPITGRPSRYELGLYDGTNPTDTEVVLLGEAYLDYEHRGHAVWIGRRKLKSPLINPQDGRLIPTLVQGIWYEAKPIDRATFSLGYLSHIAPRSTAGFYSVEHSIGLYPMGRTKDGAPSAYLGNVDSAGVFVASAKYQTGGIDLQIWDYLVENVFNTVYLEAGWRSKRDGVAPFLRLQGLAQERLGSGGSDNPEERYFEDEHSLALGAILGANISGGWLLQLSGNWITDQGRFLFPREWGREPLFVFQKRERSEGSGGQLAAVLELGKTWTFRSQAKLSTKLGYGHYHRRPAAEAALNKYALPSLLQTNWETTYSFGGALSGLTAELLIVYKAPLEDGLDNPAFRLNKVDMMNWNFFVNYTF